MTHHACPGCGHSVSARARTCPNCGEPFDDGLKWSTGHPCPICNGAGLSHDYPCESCGGQGQVAKREDPYAPFSGKSLCPACKGNGGHWDKGGYHREFFGLFKVRHDRTYHVCPACRGKGEV